MQLGLSGDGRKKRVAIILHYHYPDVAKTILKRLARLPREYKLAVTTGKGIPPDILWLIIALRVPFRIISVPNTGRDVRPFLVAAHHKFVRSCDYICKLHTKRHQNQFHVNWFNTMLSGTVRDRFMFARIVSAFDCDPDLVMVGPEPIYKSARQFMFANSDRLEKLACRLFSDRLPGDWGFFAGTMFWIRRRSIERIAASLLALEESLPFEPEPIGEDGALPHAFERFFGVIPVYYNGKVGLIDAKSGQLSLHKAPGPVNREIMKNQFLPA